MHIYSLLRHRASVNQSIDQSIAYLIKVGIRNLYNKNTNINVENGKNDNETQKMSIILLEHCECVVNSCFYIAFLLKSLVG